MKTCPGIKVNDLGAINAFLLIIKLKPNIKSIINDSPIKLEINNPYMPSLDKIIINDEKLSDNPKIINAQDLLNKYKDDLDNIKNKIDELKDELNNIDLTKSGQNNCPLDADDPDATFEKIKNGEYSSLMTATNAVDDLKDNTLDLNKVTDFITHCPSDDMLQILNQVKIPEINLGEFNNDVPENLACLFNDDKLKNSMTIIKEKLLPQDNNAVDDLNGVMTPDSFKNLDMNQSLKDNGIEITDATDLDTAPVPEFDDTGKMFVESFDTQFELGIPLATLNSTDNVYLQILNKKIQVTNMLDTSGEKLLIDKEIDMLKPFYVVFQTNGIQHDLYYVESDGTINKDSLTVQKNLSVEFIGIDDKARKHFCGYIYDIQILTFQRANFANFLKSHQFEPPPGAMYYYDWHYTRINHNLVYPLPDLNPPVKMYSEGGYTNYILHTENIYNFMENGYLTQFFCWRKFLLEYNADGTINNDFSISFWINKMDYVNGKDSTDYKTLVYDENTEYSVKYNDYTKKLRIHILKDFDFDYLIEDNLWYYCNFKYSFSEKKVYFNIRNINQELSDIKEFIIDLNNENIEFGRFTLSAMLAKKVGSNFYEYFNCKFGTLALFDYKRETAEEDLQFKKEKIVFKILNL